MGKSFILEKIVSIKYYNFIMNKGLESHFAGICIQ